MAVSALRTLLLADYVPSVTRGVVVGAQPMWWPPKQPADELDYSLDATVVMQEVGDRFVQVSAQVSPSGLSDAVVVDLTVSGWVITAWIGLGAPGSSYSVLLRAVTALGRSFSWIGFVQVLSPAFESGTPAVAATPSVVAYNNMVDTSGDQITDTSGAQILATPVVWTDRMLSDTWGRTIRDTRGLPILSRKAA